MFSPPPPQENLDVYEIMWGKCVRARQATNASIILRRKDAINMPDNQGKNTNTHMLTVYT
jgi:hypothetical protein